MGHTVYYISMSAPKALAILSNIFLFGAAAVLLAAGCVYGSAVGFNGYIIWTIALSSFIILQSIFGCLSAAKKGEVAGYACLNFFLLIVSIVSLSYAGSALANLNAIAGNDFAIESDSSANQMQLEMNLFKVFNSKANQCGMDYTTPNSGCSKDSSSDGFASWFWSSCAPAMPDQVEGLVNDTSISPKQMVNLIHENLDDKGYASCAAFLGATNHNALAFCSCPEAVQDIAASAIWWFLAPFIVITAVCFLIMLSSCFVAAHPPTRTAVYNDYYGNPVDVVEATQVEDGAAATGVPVKGDLEAQNTEQPGAQVPVYVVSNDYYYDYASENPGRSGGGACCCIFSMIALIMLIFYVPRSPWLQVSDSVPIVKSADGTFSLKQAFYMENYNYFGVNYYSITDVETVYGNEALFASESSVANAYVPAGYVVITRSNIPQTSSAVIEEACTASPTSTLWVRTSGIYSTSLGTYRFNEHQTAICP